MKSVHDPDTYQQTYQDRLRRVRLSIEKRLQYKNQCFDPAMFFNWLGLLDICTPEDKPEVEAELKQITDGVPQEAIDAAWAWYAVNMAAEYDTDGDTIIMAYQCLMGETEGAKQARKGRQKNWQTQPLIEMCNIARQHKPKRTAKDIYHALPDITPVAPIRSIRMNDLGSLTIESTGKDGDKNYEFSTFKSRLSEWTKAGLIKRKKLL